MRCFFPFRNLRFLLLVALAVAPAATAQVWGEVGGRITADGQPVPGATVLVRGTNFGTAANSDGRYRLRLPAGRYALVVSAVGFVTRSDSVAVRRDHLTTHDVVLAAQDVPLENVNVEGQVPNDAGVVTLSPEEIRAIPNPLNDALASVKVLPGVTSNNETSNAYSVRGGGYNENLFFVDGFEIYRPFRTRQGEQEGLGLVNGDLVERMTLYAGGFPARYGGKLASALDVAYLRPSGPLAGTAYASTLDGGLALSGGVGERLGIAVAGRAARASRFFATQELEGVYDPEFQDGQALLRYALAPGHEFEALGLVARHRFRLEPAQRFTTFGIFPNHLRTVAFDFDGQETDGYDVRFGGARLTNRLSPWLRVEHEASYFETEEFEKFDVTGEITLFRNEPDPTRPPDDPFNQIQTGQARQHDFADNRVRVATLTGGGRYRFAVGRHAAEVGWQARRLTFDDRLFEYTTLDGVDSTGAPITVTVDSLNDAARLSTWQGALWAEDAFDLSATPGRFVVTPGVRADYFAFNGEWTVSPRLSMRYRLNPVTTLTAATGLYHQAPTYRELRGEPDVGETILGALNDSLLSQRALLFTVGGERFFPRNRFVLRAEAWYKKLDRLTSYDVQNVRVLYSGENDSEGYAYGLDLQWRGEFVPGLESWVTYGFLVARERFLGPADTSAAAALEFERRGGGEYIPRPTDRRHNFALFLQDHVPGDESWTLHLRTLFGTGVPYTPPARGDTINAIAVQVPGFRHIARYPEYFRFDLGVGKRIEVGAGLGGRPLMLHLTGELLNVFNMKNTISYDWIGGPGQRWERVPTRLTPRTVNVRLRVDF
ncbi:MAG TPA: TonB-dependent receptor [Rubricoccaceae bacterium]|nr:TonB-dependent receptor [Rubricoccaceae bacterium]